MRGACDALAEETEEHRAEVDERVASLEEELQSLA